MVEVPAQNCSPGLRVGVTTVSVPIVLETAGLTDVKPVQSSPELLRPFLVHPDQYWSKLEYPKFLRMSLVPLVIIQVKLGAMMAPLALTTGQLSDSPAAVTRTAAGLTVGVEVQTIAAPLPAQFEGGGEQGSEGIYVAGCDADERYNKMADVGWHMHMTFWYRLQTSPVWFQKAVPVPEVLPYSPEYVALLLVKPSQSYPESLVPPDVHPVQ